LKGDGGHHFEEAGMPRQLFPIHELAGETVHLAVNLCELVVGDFLPDDPYTLIDAHQVRGSIEPSGQARGLQDRRQSRGCRTLAVGAGNQDARETMLWML